MNSLELFAFDYITYAENDAYNLPIVYVFAIIFGLMHEVNFRLKRSTYFLSIGVIVFFSSITAGIYFLLFSAMLGGYLFAIVLIDIIIWAFIGFLFVFIAKARSNDAYGHSRYAFLAFIPFANLWLLFSPSKDGSEQKHTSFTIGVSAVIIGFVVLVAGRGLGLAIESELNSHASTKVAQKHGIEIASKYIKYYATRQNINAALNYYKALDVVGQKIDEITYLNDIIVEENSITYKFFITDNSITGFTEERLKDWETYVCSSNRTLFDIGASVIFHYYSDASPMLAYIVGDSEVCSL